MKFSKKIIGTVLASYVGVEVDLSKTQWYKEEAKLRNRFIKATLVGVNLGNEVNRAIIEHNIKTQNSGLQWLDFSALKLILKPLSSITDKEVLEIAKLNGYKIYGDYRKYSLEITRAMLSGMRLDIGLGCSSIQAYQYLISRGYDLPHFLLGGKTLKQSGIAIYKQQLKKLKK